MEDDHSMGRRDGTRFTILDAMAMVAAAAVGVALSRSYYGEVMSVERIQGGSFEYRAGVYLAALLALPFAAALAWCRLQRPYRPIRRLAREPGSVALLAVTVCVVTLVLDQVLMLMLPGPPGTRFIGGAWRPLIGPAGMLATITGPATCAAWSLQWLAGYWRPRSGWIDRAGRALGITWIILFVLRSWLLLHLWP
jgi:hypothetical protein